MDQIPFSKNYNINPRAKSNPALSYQLVFGPGRGNYKYGWKDISLPAFKTFKVMKNFYFIIGVVFILLSLPGYSQVKVYEDNRVKIFGDKPTDDLNKDLSMQVYGSYGEYLANGRLGFGDYGTKYYDNPKVFVGEFGENIDSDKLELRGETGVYLTSKQGFENNDIIGYMSWVSVFLTQRFYFNVDVYADGLILNSDEKFKRNINPIEGVASKLKQTRPVTFNLKNSETKSPMPTESFSPASEKEKDDLALLITTEEKMKNLNRQRIGFLAEEIQIVFPELVEKDSKGFLYVDYIGLVPILVESIKEQQTQIATIKNLLQKL
jgi:hypothetical protein